MPQQYKNQFRLTPEQQRLVEDNIELAEDKARTIHANYRHIEYDELYSTALLGLCNIAKNFNPNHGSKFSTYAYIALRGEILRYIRDKAYTVRFPRPVLENRKNVFNAVKEGLTFEEVAEKLKIPIKLVIECQQSWKIENVPLNNHEDSTIHILIEQKDSHYTSEFTIEQHQSIESLSDTEFALLERYFTPIRRVKMGKKAMEKALGLLRQIKSNSAIINPKVHKLSSFTG